MPAAVKLALRERFPSLKQAYSGSSGKLAWTLLIPGNRKQLDDRQCRYSHSGRSSRISERRAARCRPTLLRDSARWSIRASAKRKRQDRPAEHRAGKRCVRSGRFGLLPAYLKKKTNKKKTRMLRAAVET